MEFMIIVVAATLGSATPSGGNPPPEPLARRHFADQLSCEQAVSTATPPPGTKLVCVPTGSLGTIHTAH